MTSCVKSKLYYTPHPDKGAVVVSADWSNRSEAYAIPVEYTLYHICCGTSDPFMMPGEGEKCCPELFEPGSHTLVAHNAADKISVSGMTAAVAALQDGTIDPMPGYLLSAVQDIEAVPDDTIRVVIPMRQRVRDLHIELTVTEGDPELIESIEGSLSGIAGTFDLVQQKIAGEAKTVAPSFTRSGDKVTSDMRLLGTAGDSQILTLGISFSDDRAQTTEEDLTEQLSGFNDGDMTGALTIRGNLRIPVGLDITSVIIDWEPGNGADGETGDAYLTDNKE